MFDLSYAKTLSEAFTAQNIIIIIVASLMNVALNVYLARKFMQIIQQSGYEVYDYNKWLSRRENVYVTRLFMVVMLSVLAYLVYSIALSFTSVDVVASTAFLFYITFAIGYIRSDFKRKSKCPLVLTPRVLRLYATFALLTFVATALVLIGALTLGYQFKTNEILVRVRFCLVCLTPLLIPVIVPLANAINKPFEKAHNRKYVEKCKDELAAYPDLIKIGITGSYGKTSVKEILRTILSEKYSVLATPQSYNTPMGICKTVKKLDDTYDVFIAEMGARHEGDIKELCEIVKPQLGVINGVIEHHMETFSSLTQIIKTKFELAECIDGGTVFLTTDNENTAQMKYKCGNNEVIMAGVNTEYEPYVYATDVKISKSGSAFTLNIGEKKVECSTLLIGEHNVSNVLLAAAVADKLGLTIEQISAGIARVKPIKHRLEILSNDNGVTVIDDSYNSNVSGTKAALNVFNSFEGRKIVITPGIVELGRIEDRENYLFGKRLAAVVDVAVLIDSPAAYKIRDGLLAEGFPLENIYMAKSLKDGTAFYKKNAKEGDVVLFENDLPDKFS